MTDERRRWTDQEKQWAYEVWALLADQKANKAARLLAEGPGEDEDSERPPLAIPARTIRYWVEHENWEERIERDSRAIFPSIHARVHRMNMVNSIKAAERLGEILRGEIAVSDKVLMDAIKTTQDRTGHMPYVRNSDNTAHAGPQRDYSESVAGLNEDELLAELLKSATRRLPEGDPHGS